MKLRRCARAIGGAFEMPGKRIMARLVCLALAAATGAGRAEELRLPVPDADATPTAVVTALESALLTSMRAGSTWSFAQRQAALRPVVDRAFDFPRMGRFIFGSTWFTLPQDQAERFVATFAELSLATYAARFDEHDGQTFRLVSGDDADGRFATVRTQLLDPADEPVEFEYLLNHGDGWRVSSVTANGVNDLALRRSLYSELYDSGAMDAVIARMRAQIEALANE